MNSQLTAKGKSQSPSKDKVLPVKKLAVIIAGSSLAFIDKVDELRKKFLEVTDKADVVLACRVSPK